MNVEDLLKKKKIDYRVSGSDYVIECLNPKHEDNNPSMRVDKILGIFNCLSCGYKGNLFHLFNEQYDKLSISRERLAKKIEETRMNSIGLDFPSIIQKVEYDYRVSKETIQEFEAFKSVGSDFDGRINFPIRDLKGNIVGFCGRAEDPYKTPKYKFSPKHTRLPLFPLHKVEPIQNRVILVEGIFDVLNFYDKGIKNSLCIFGTNALNLEKLNLLKIMGISGIDLCYDPDEAGSTAADEDKEMIEEQGIHARKINLKSGDPGDLSKKAVQTLKSKLYGD